MKWRKSLVIHTFKINFKITVFWFHICDKMASGLLISRASARCYECKCAPRSAMIACTKPLKGVTGFDILGLI